MKFRIRKNSPAAPIARRTWRWVIAAFCFGILNGASVLAEEPTLHHSVSITGVITAAGRLGKPTGETVTPFNNTTILKAAIENSPPSNTKVSDLDIVEEDDSGQLTIIYRSNSAIFSTLGDTRGATESSSVAFDNVTSYLQYRIYTGFTLNLPMIYPSATVSFQFANHLDKHGNFTVGTGSFFGGVALGANPPYLVRGQVATGSRVYQFIDNDD